MGLQNNDTIFHDWKIKRIIGEGSFGTVYEIEKKEEFRTYRAAAKVISIPKNQQDYRQVMSEEMSHENVTTYYKSLVDDVLKECDLMERMKGDSHIVSYEDHHVIREKDKIGWTIQIRMELLRPLIDYMDENEVRVQDVIKLGIDICQGLETCEKFHVIHRDIKPDNIFISDIGNYKLGDFGVSKVLERSEVAVSKKGTQLFMAPEVYRGDQYDATVDLYSLGLVLFRLLNYNRLPFYPEYPNPQLYQDKEIALRKRMSGEPIPYPHFGGEKLGKIIQKACSFQSEDRYQSPSEMRAELEKLMRDKEWEQTEGIASKNAIVKEKKERSVISKQKDPGETIKIGGNRAINIEEILDRIKEEEQKKQEIIEKKKKIEKENLQEERLRLIQQTERMKEENLRGIAEDEKKRREEEEKKLRLELEAEQREEAERKVREKAERKAKEEAERRAREEVERKVKEEAERRAREEAKQKAKEEAERRARKEAERKVKEEAERRAREEAERKAKEEAKQHARKETEPKPIEEVKQRAQNEKNNNRNNGGKFIKLAMVIMIFSIIIVFASVCILAEKVPDVQGKTYEEANRKLQEKGMIVDSTEYQFSDNLAGQVIKQEPEKITFKKKVSLKISKGKKDVTLPVLLNQQLGQVQQTIGELNANLQCQVNEIYSLTVPADTVCAQSPDGGANVKNGGIIAITVSKGSASMVSVLGSNIEEAQGALQPFGLQISVVEEFNSKVEKGKVISQSIPEGTQIETGMALELKVSKGIQMILVPKIQGLSKNKAVKKLTKAGFSENEIKIVKEYSNKKADTVISQSVKAETEVKKGSKITVFISKGKKPVQRSTVTSTRNRTTSPRSSKRKSSSNNGWNWNYID